jgi:hypothetical protein
MKCKNCDKEMELVETDTYYFDDTHIEVEEHWWCPACDATPARFVTYQMVKERWEK